MKRVRTSLFFVAVMVVLALCGSAWGVESSESIQGLISHWKFDEGSGTIAHDSAGTNNGTLNGNPAWTTGQIDGALSFDGVDDYVEIPDDDSLTPSSGLTISAWVYINELSWSDRTAIVCKYDYYVGDRAYQVELGTDNKPDVSTVSIHVSQTTSPHNGKITFGTTALQPGQWYHVVATFEANHQEIYVNGIEETDDTDPGIADSIPNNNLPVYIGYNKDENTYFDGTIDEVAIYDRALSAEEVEQLYKDGLGELVGLEIVGPNEVAENFSASYKAIAYYDNNSTRDVTDSALWAVEPNMAANIDGNGILTTKDVVREQAATILASYTGGDVTVEAEKAIDIFPICPTGTALQFDGDDDYVDCGSGAVFPVGNSDRTLAGWVKTTGTSLGQLLSYGSGATGQAMTLGHNGGAVFISAWAAPQYSTNDFSVNDGRWHNIAFVLDSQVGKTYVDGILRDARAFSPNTIPGRSKIGSRLDAAVEFFNGAIDEVCIYNRALSAEEIQANMHIPLQGDEPGLVGYWNFDEGEGQIVYDLSGNGNDGQLGSTPEADISDPAWVDSDAPIGICNPYLIATLATERAVARKTALLEELLASLAQEWAAYEALEELLESGDYGDLNKGDIVTAKQKIHSATRNEEQAIDALEKSIEKLKDALSALGYEPEDR